MIKKLVVVASIFLIAVGSLVVWRQQTAARAERLEAEILKGLSVDEVRLLLESQKQSDLEGVLSIIATPESRKLFLDGLREHLALAAEARREGLAEDKNFKRNFEYKKNILLADLYRAKIEAESGKAFVVPKEELEAILNDPSNASEVSADLKALREIQTAVSKVKDNGFVPPPLQGEALTRARENWARTKILSDRAKADKEFIDRPELELRCRVLESGILSADYLRTHWSAKVKATEAEVAKFLSENPQYDLGEKTKRAEGVLKRAIGGEDFARLVSEYSEHRPSKPKGGSMEIDVAAGDWASIIDATTNLKPGQIAPSLVRSEYGLHVVRFEGRKAAGTPQEAIEVRHILFQDKFEQPGITNPNIPAPFMTPTEIARLEIEKAKRNRFVADILARNPIVLPADFEISQ
jgi:parvulin-like peptidyl-prolyl isomerase